MDRCLPCAGTVSGVTGDGSRPRPEADPVSPADLADAARFAAIQYSCDPSNQGWLPVAGNRRWPGALRWRAVHYARRFGRFSASEDVGTPVGRGFARRTLGRHQQRGAVPHRERIGCAIFRARRSPAPTMSRACSQARTAVFGRAPMAAWLGSGTGKFRSPLARPANRSERRRKEKTAPSGWEAMDRAWPFGTGPNSLAMRSIQCRVMHECRRCFRIPPMPYGLGPRPA